MLNGRRNFGKIQKRWFKMQQLVTEDGIDASCPKGIVDHFNKFFLNIGITHGQNYQRTLLKLIHLSAKKNLRIWSSCYFPFFRSAVLQHDQERKFVVSRLEENTTYNQSIYNYCVMFTFVLL